MNPNNDPAEDTAHFFEFTIDPDFPARTKGVTVFASSDDYPSITKTVATLKAKVNGLSLREYTNKGHFVLESLGSPESPEQLQELL
jgi:hypothetical protein